MNISNALAETLRNSSTSFLSKVYNSFIISGYFSNIYSAFWKCLKKSIKYGIIFQNSSLIKISELFSFYFDKSNPNIIKNDENEYEFTLNDNYELHYIFTVITEEKMKHIGTIYTEVNFFLIFIDIQNDDALKNLELYIDKLIACSEDITKKIIYLRCL